MRVDRIASAVSELEVVEPSWHPERLNRDFTLSFSFRSHDEQGRRTYPVSHEAIDMLDKAYETTDEEKQIAVEGARKAIETIDGAIRDFREYGDRPTTIDVNYRAGLPRAVSLLGEFVVSPVLKLIGSPIVMLPPGSAHVDGRRGKDEDTVLLCRGGTPTIVYEGPLYRRKIDSEPINDFFLARFSRFLAVNPRILPQDTAVLINSEATLHRQAAQFHRRTNPSVFLRAIIKPESE